MSKVSELRLFLCFMRNWSSRIVVEKASGQENQDDLICPLVLFSTQGWSDLWVSKHWIAYEFAKDRPVLFVEPPARGGRLRPKLRRIGAGLWALQLETLPYPYRAPALLRPLWRYPLQTQFASALDVLQLERFDVLTFDPHCQPLLARFKDRVRRLVYYAVDPPLGKEDFFWPERQVVSSSDTAIAVTRRLATLLAEESGRADIHVLPHGIDAQASEVSTDDQPLPHAFYKLSYQRPVIGYTGAIHDLCVDFSLIRNTARARPDWQFVLVGPYEGSKLTRKGFDIHYFDDCPNVIFCGALPFSELKNAIRVFDVCIVPYRADLPNNWARRSPFKVLHYFAQGKPVVMSNVPAVEDYPGGLIYEYETAADFMSAVAEALLEDKESDLRRRRSELAQGRSFSRLITELKHYFDKERVA